MDAQEATSVTVCPKCGTRMLLAVTIPHPIAVQMQRHTYLCSKCNQSKTYMLQSK